MSTTKHIIDLVRLYDDPQPKGYRVLVDRLWPRGVTKADLAVDDWPKQLAPSPKLRTWFGHDPKRWDEFVTRYREELSALEGEAREMLTRAGHKRIILLFGAKDVRHTHAIVLKEFLEKVRSETVNPQRKSR